MNRLLTCLALAASVSAHGVLLKVVGANDITAPGACVLDGTPRDCIVNACGAQADTGIIRDEEITRGKYGPLGWTQGGGNCKPDAVISEYMGIGTAPRYTKGKQPTGQKDNLEAFGLESRAERRAAHWNEARQSRSRRGIFDLPIIGVAGVGGDRKFYPQETIVGDFAGDGKTYGLPTTDDEGQITVVYRQINQDGGGPLTAAIDGTSAATDYKAFKSARITDNVPGDGFLGLSLATNSNFNVKVKLPDGMVCEGKVAGLDNVCFVRIRNQAFAGPFGGAGFFTQSNKARKRALDFRRKRSLSK